MTRRPIVGISMKTYKNDFNENIEYLNSLNTLLQQQGEGVDVFFLPSLGLLHSIARELHDTKVLLGAQNIGVMPNGAQTGEFAIDVLDGLNNVKYVELGHAERRTRLQETLEDVALKIKLSLEKGYTPVVCLGEKEKYPSLSELKKALTPEVLESLKYVEKEDLKNIVIAYEPYWAIGQAEAADADYVHRSHKVILEIIEEKYGLHSSDDVRIIYGGSVSIDTVESIANDENVHGVFVGRFGHDVSKFVEIVEKVKEIKYV